MPTIIKNGIAYGGSADQADLILATDSSGNNSNVQAELDKRLEISHVVNNGTTTNAGYALDARYGKTLFDYISSNKGKGRYYTISGNVENSAFYESLLTAIINDATNNTNTILFNVNVDGAVYAGIADIASASYASIILFSYSGYMYQASRNNSTTWEITLKANSIYLNTPTVNWESSDIPEAFINAMSKAGIVYTGSINASARCAAIGIKASASAAAVFIFTYSGNVHFWVKFNGSWADRKIAWAS